MTETQAVVQEFGGSRTSMAAEILRLRRALDDVRFDLSRAALGGVSGLLIDPMPRAGVVPRPIGYRITDD
jgi:hypothetical protein